MTDREWPDEYPAGWDDSDQEIQRFDSPRALAYTAIDHAHLIHPKHGQRSPAAWRILCGECGARFEWEKKAETSANTKEQRSSGKH
jgi:hypothetical protein